MAKKLVRYNCASATRPCLELSVEGGYISYSDYAALKTENERLRRTEAAADKILEHKHGDGMNECYICDSADTAEALKLFVHFKTKNLMYWKDQSNRLTTALRRLIEEVRFNGSGMLRDPGMLRDMVNDAEKLLDPTRKNQ